VVLVLVAITVAVYYDFLSTLNAFIREPTVRHTLVPESNGPPFEVVYLPGKGKGIVALRDIKQGELLIRERPLFLVPRQTQESPTALIYEKLRILDKEQLASFYGLSYIEPAEKYDSKEEHASNVALSIFQTNAVSAGEAVGLFPQMARLNHGCSSAFHAVYTWREHEGVIVVIALKSVKKGEEILTTYTNTKKSRTERRNYLLQQYAFNCTCAVCSLPDAHSRASDKRLTQMSELYDRLASWGHANIDGEQALELVRKIWDTGEEEGYWSERGRLAADATWISAAASDLAATREWATLAARWYGYELGVDSHYVQGMQDIISRPQTHQAWGTRDMALVGGPGTRL